MANCKKLLLLCMLCIAALRGSAQLPQWAIGIGSAENDDGRSCAIAPNGNVYLAGFFSGTVDLDPSAATHNVVSNGETDIFLACYTSAGAFLWGLSVGDTSTDGALNLAVDKDNNAIIVGYFHGQHVNFDPLGTGKYLSDHGIMPPVLETGGDGFAAKYNPSGACAWAVDLGGKTEFDICEGVGVDENDNVYVGGAFDYSMDIDPGPGVTTLNSLNGTAYLIKYTPAGNLVWGFTLGSGGNSAVDNTVWNIRAEKGYLYLGGIFQGVSSFDPAHVAAPLTSAGLYDGYLAKYDTLGNYVFATQISGTNNESVNSLVLDSLNIYITGYTLSPSISFGGAGQNIVMSPGGGTNSDLFLAKYTKKGTYVWGETIGGSGDDNGIDIAVNNNLLYITGYFQDTVDFDPSPATANLVSNGKNDIYLCKYDTAGKYICGFNVGSAGNEQGRHISFDAQGYMYACGQFTGISTNFSPVPAPVYLSTHGEGDVFLVKYDWRGVPTAPNGYFVADTVCYGTPGLLVFVATGGTAPYTIVYTDGYNMDTVYNVYNYERLYTASGPAVTTTFRLLLILSAGHCDPPGQVDTTATILVHPVPVIAVSHDTTVCPGAVVQLYVTPGYTYYWSGSGVDSPAMADPQVTAATAITCTVAATDSNGCVTRASVNIGVYGTEFRVSELNQPCIGDTAQLSATGADTYLWYTDTDSTLSADTIASPRAWPMKNTTYLVAMTDLRCNIKDTLSLDVVVKTLPQVKITEARDVDCGARAGMLAVTGAQHYRWTPDTYISDTTSATPVVTPPVSTVYYVTGTNDNGCTGTDSAYIQTFYDGTGRLFAPTAFTPNGDGKNDCFSVHIPGNVSSYQLNIYNRWGQVVYSSSTYGTCWDGVFNGTPQDMGSYFYFYKCTSSACGELKGEGDVQLIR